MGAREYLAWNQFGWAIGIAIVLVAIIAGILVRSIISSRRLERPPVVVWALLLGLHAAVFVVQDLPPDLIAAMRTFLLVAAVISVTLWVGDLAARALSTAAGRNQTASVQATGLVRNLVRFGVMLVGLLVLLSTLGVSVTPILTTLGIGGLAVALALQNTLANLFAGLHVTFARHVRIGDRVRLETGQEGEVEDIGWGVSRVRADDGDQVVIPNGRLASSVVLVRRRPRATAPRAGAE